MSSVVVGGGGDVEVVVVAVEIEVEIVVVAVVDVNGAGSPVVLAPGRRDCRSRANILETVSAH